MPVQRYDTRPVRRPSGLVPPVADLAGVTELRLHGVGGTTPQDLLGDDAPQQVSGDRIAGFYRTADVAGRHVEAYSWGGMTSRSGLRVLWLLLFPFALANVAGWMCSRRTYASPWRFRLHRTTVRWSALAITVNLLLLVSVTTMDLLGYQCGGQDACAEDSWLLRPLRDALLADHPGRRILAGALPPIALVVLLAILALRSIGRYEAARPPAGPAPSAPGSRSAAQPGVDLSHPSFWDGQRSARNLGCLHIAAGFAFLALAIAHTAHTASHAASYPASRAGGGPAAGGWPWAVACAAALVVLLGALVFAALDACPAAVPPWLLGLGVVSVSCAAWYAASRPAYAQPAGYLPGMRAVTAATMAGVFGTLLLVLLAELLGGWRRGTFVIFGPFVTLALSVLALNVVLLAVMNRAGDLWGTVTTRVPPAVAAPGRAELYVHPLTGRIVEHLTLLPLALLLLFTGYELAGYWRAGTDRRGQARIRQWYLDNVPRPEREKGWQCSTVEDRRVQLARRRRLWMAVLGRGWEARIARARQLTRVPHDLDKLLTATAGAGFALMVALQVRYWAFHRLPWGTQWTFTMGSYLATAIPIALILVLRNGWTNLRSRRRIGVIWDVTTFWPRAYHPLAPPSYAERAVPELQRRLWRVSDSGGRVVLAAHSQGTVLAAAALLQPDNRPDDGVVALVTFGSPLRTLYGWAFPAYFSDETLRRLAPAEDGVGPDPAVRAWRNFSYPTDYIGGPVFASGTAAGIDVELPDPGTNWYIYGQPEPAAARHSGYWTDAAVWRTVDGLAEELANAARPPRQRWAGARP